MCHYFLLITLTQLVTDILFSTYPPCIPVSIISLTLNIINATKPCIIRYIYLPGSSGYTLHENTYLTDNEYMYSYCLEMDSFVNHGIL